jgi:hypothetical protein
MMSYLQVAFVFESSCETRDQEIAEWSYYNKTNWNKLRGFGPRANYTDRATAARWRS